MRMSSILLFVGFSSLTLGCAMEMDTESCQDGRCDEPGSSDIDEAQEVQAILEGQSSIKSV